MQQSRVLPIVQEAICRHDGVANVPETLSREFAPLTAQIIMEARTNPDDWKNVRGETIV